MKKCFTILLSAVMLFCISACGNEANYVDIPEKLSISPKNNTTVSLDNETFETFENPVISLDDENVWPDYGVGDPFVMRWNGMYYLYNSTKDFYVGIQCWQSENLVDWTYMGFCATEELTESAYAPEVIYYNGKFYMCTSPAGNGHYILVSDSPTGPFVSVTDNFGLSIDGNFFIDDDGEWYFTTAGCGINAYKMTSPTEVDKSTEVNTQLIMQAGEDGTDWTEGSMLIKYKDKYYMTYCGNHVWSYGYRINYASGDSPLELEPGVNNPILINTDPSTVSGIGHSSTVMGPNLDSYFIVYHSSYVAPQREMNIAPLIFNGSYMQALGPTVTSQQKPEMPDIYSYFNSEESLDGWTVKDSSITDGVLVIGEGGRVLSQNAVSSDYTAEFNIISTDGKVGILFGYRSEKDYSAAYVDVSKSELEIAFTRNGESETFAYPINGSFGEKLDFSVLQKLSVKKCENTYDFFINDIHICEVESSGDIGGAVGVESVSGSATVGFVGAEGNVWLSSMKEYYKPISGELQAITCVEDGLTLVEHDGTDYVSVSAEESYNYFVNVSSESRYSLAVSYQSDVDTSVEFYFNGELLASGVLLSTDGENSSAIFRDISLKAGTGVFTVKVTSGKADVFSYTFAETKEVEADYTVDFNSPIYSEGDWTVENGKFLASGKEKVLYGDYGWEDYSLSVNLQLKHNVLISNILFRVTQPALGDAGNDIKLGSDFFMGYFVNVTRTNKQATISLNKENYGPTELAKEIVEINAGESVEVKIEVYGSEIKVYLRGELVIEYNDPDPFLNGAVGLRNVATAEVSDMKVYK